MMEKLSAQESTNQKLIQTQNRRNILSHKCTNCCHLMLETVLFCEKCSGSKFEHAELEGTGTVVTYTIQAVAPEGFEDVGSYAWVVFKIDNSQLRASGFLTGIKTPAELPIGTRVRVARFDPKHGLILQK